MILVSKIPELCHLIPVLAAGPGAHENFNTFHWALRKIFTWVTGAQRATAGDGWLRWRRFKTWTDQ